MGNAHQTSCPWGQFFFPLITPTVDAKKQLSCLAELQSKVMVTAQQRPAHSDYGVNPFAPDLNRLALPLSA